MSAARPSIILDRVYEHITLAPVIRRAIDTPVFQRLRTLRQLGASSYLYPGALHTRFEHSIGVQHLAQTWVNTLAEKQPGLGITPEEKTEVMLAGLLHDVGHGAFSHVFEHVIMPRLGLAYHHEDMSVQLARKVILDDLGLGEQAARNVSNIIVGRPPSPQRAFLAQIIHNDVNGVDVDRLDYYMRDALCAFGKTVAEVRPRRLFFGSAVVRCGEGSEDAATMEIAFEQKMATTVRELCQLRARLHRQVYQHPVTLRVGHMIGDVIGLAAEEDADFARYLKDVTSSPEEFLKLGDFVFDMVGTGACFSKAAKARTLYERLQRRDLYSMVGIAHLSDTEKFNAAREDILKDALAKKAHAANSDMFSFEEVRDSLIVDRVTVHHGSKNKDPVAATRFFNPKATDIGDLESGRVVALPRGALLSSESRPLALSSLTPAVFQEREIVVICRHGGKHPIAVALRKHFEGVKHDVGYHLCGLSNVNA